MNAKAEVTPNSVSCEFVMPGQCRAFFMQGFNMTEGLSKARLASKAKHEFSCFKPCEPEIIEINACGLSGLPFANMSIWLPASWPTFFGVPMKDSDGRDIGTMIFKITKHSRGSMGQQLRRFELIELLPPDSEVAHPLLRLTTFSVRSKEHA